MGRFGARSQKVRRLDRQLWRRDRLVRLVSDLIATRGREFVIYERPPSRGWPS